MENEPNIYSVNIEKIPLSRAEDKFEIDRLKTLLESQSVEMQRIQNERAELELELHEMRRNAKEMAYTIETLQHKLQHIGRAQDLTVSNTEGLEFIHRKMSPNSSVFESAAYLFEKRGEEMSDEEFKRRVKGLKKLVEFYVLTRSPVLNPEDYHGKTPEEYVQMVEDDSCRGGLAELKVFVDYYETEIKVISNGELLAVPVYHDKSYEKVALLLKDTEGGIHYEPIVGVLPKGGATGFDATIFPIDDNKSYSEALKISKELMSNQSLI